MLTFCSCTHGSAGLLMLGFTQLCKRHDSCVCTGSCRCITPAGVAHASRILNSCNCGQMHCTLAAWRTAGQTAYMCFAVFMLEYTDQLYCLYLFLPGKGMCRLWQLQAQGASNATPKGKQFILKRQALQAQKASNASPKGGLCKPERQAMQAKPYLRFVFKVERLLLFRSLRCCAGGCPLTPLIRPILAACTT